MQAIKGNAQDYIIGDLDERQHLVNRDSQSPYWMTRRHKKGEVPSIKMPAEKFINHILSHSSIYIAVLFIVAISLVAIAFEKQFVVLNSSKTTTTQLYQNQVNIPNPSNQINQNKTNIIQPHEQQKHEPSPQTVIRPDRVKSSAEIPASLIPAKFQPVSAHRIVETGNPTVNTYQTTWKPQGSKIVVKNMVAGITGQQKDFAGKLLQLKNQNLDEMSPLALLEKQYYETKYKISQYPELPFCIVVPSYNNAKNNLHIKNIRSVLMQDYSNYHVVFIDDASTDGTGDQIEQYLANNQTRLPSSRYTIIKNKVQQRAMPNLRMAAKQYCRPEEIFLIADGDDELVGRQVLRLFSAIFQREKAWFVYSNFLSIRHSVGYSRPFPLATIKNNKYRAYPFVTSHLRAFYTQLFLNIKEEDLKDEKGEYLKAANDVAICIPILEMSHERVVYLPELTYFYNSNTGQNNHQVRLKEQKGNDRMLRKRKPYKPLSLLFQKVELDNRSQVRTRQSASSSPINSFQPQTNSISPLATTQFQQSIEKNPLN